MKPWTALAIIGAFTAIAFIAVSFIESGMKVEISNPLHITIGTDHKPAPTINYNIKKEGVWGL
jgi:hypothetical protein